jgi:hypothetical protein
VTLVPGKEPATNSVGYFTIKLMDKTKQKVSQQIKVEYFK